MKKEKEYNAVWIDRRIMIKFKKKAFKEGISLCKVVENLLIEYLKNDKSKNKDIPL